MKDIKLKIKQFQHESDAWKRKLESWLQENVYLKNRLAELLSQDHVDMKFLDAAELFLNGFVRKDEIIYLLRNDIARFDKLLKEEEYKDKALAKTIEQKNKMMRKELLKLDSTFNDVKMQFNNFLSKSFINQ